MNRAFASLVTLAILGASCTPAPTPDLEGTEEIRVRVDATMTAERRILQATQTTEAATLAAPTQTPTLESTATNEPPSPYVLPILFVPSNLSTNLAYLPAINETLSVIADWYATQLEGKTFNYVDAVEVVGQFELRHYCPKTTTDTQCIQIPGELGADGDDIHNVLSDLNSQGYTLRPNIIMLIFWVGGYGYAAGHQGNNNNGWAALGDWAIDGIAGFYEEGVSRSNCSDSQFAWLWCTKSAQTGSVAHELGHAFGLPHPSDDGTKEGEPNWWLSTLMAVWWDFPGALLIDSEVNPEKTVLLPNPFFNSSVED